MSDSPTNSSELDLAALTEMVRPAIMLIITLDGAKQELASGVGFLVSHDGYLLTNRHLLFKAVKAVAIASNGDQYFAQTIVAEDPDHDLVLLKIDGENFSHLLLGSSENVEANDRVAMVGSVIESMVVLADGNVRAVRDPFLGRYRWLRIRATISPATHGSPVLDAEGKVVGIMTVISANDQSVNLAVAVEAAKTLVSKAQNGDELVHLSRFGRKVQTEIFLDPLFLSALSAIMTGDLAGALKNTRAASSKHPRSSLLDILTAEIYLALNDLESAVAAIQRPLQRDPLNPDFWFLLAVLYGRIENVKFDEEIQALQHALELQSDFPQAWRQLGRSYTRRFKYEEAIAAYQQFVALVPESAETWRQIGEHYCLLNQFEAAEEAFEQAVQYKPNSPATWYELGDISEHLGKHQDALDAYENAVALNPNFVEAWTRLGAAAVRFNQFEAAVEAYKQFLRLEPDDIDAHYHLGVAYSKLQRLEEAIVEFQKAIGLNPDHAESWLGLGMVYGQQDKTDEEIKAYMRAIQARPDFAEAHTNLGATYDGEGKYEDAIHSYQQAIKHKPDFASAHYNLALLHHKLGEKDKARKIFLELEKLDPALSKTLAKTLTQPPR